MENQDVRFGGMIVKMEHLTSKNGKGWGAFTIEDYSGTVDFRIFGEEYLKFRPFLSEKQFVFIKAHIKGGYTTPDGRTFGPKIVFTHIGFLEDALQENIDKLQMAVELPQVNEETLFFVKNLSQHFKGSTPFNFLIIGKSKEQEKDIELPMNSHGTKVKVCKEFFDALSNTSFIYRLNNEPRWLNLAIEAPADMTSADEELLKLMEEVEID